MNIHIREINRASTRSSGSPFLGPKLRSSFFPQSRDSECSVIWLHMFCNRTPNFPEYDFKYAAEFSNVPVFLNIMFFLIFRIPWNFPQYPFFPISFFSRISGLPRCSQGPVLFCWISCFFSECSVYPDLLKSPLVQNIMFFSEFTVSPEFGTPNSKLYFSKNLGNHSP